MVLNATGKNTIICKIVNHRIQVEDKFFVGSLDDITNVIVNDITQSNIIKNKKINMTSMSISLFHNLLIYNFSLSIFIINLNIYISTFFFHKYLSFLLFAIYQLKS